MGHDDLSRRRVVCGAALAGVSVVLGACSSGEETGGGQGGGSAGGGASGEALGATSEVPVGGGKVFEDQKVVVTQPEPGTFKGFTAVCPHQGATLGSVRDGVIVCPRHGSQFAVADGSVEHGPATRGLATVAIKVQGDQITRA